MMDPIKCPQCGSTEISIYEWFHLLRRYVQTGSGIDPERPDNEEPFPKDEPLTFSCDDCEHEWVSEDATQIYDLL
jgi:hypothetical protein